jgi:3-ketosteroid 9alpha-monooxygenase subunit B
LPESELLDADLPRDTVHRLEVAEVIEETPDAKSLVLTVPDGAADAFQYDPGQFLTVRVPSDRTGSVARCYSLSSSPHTNDALKVTVKRVIDGYGSNWLCDHAEAGMALDVLPPAGGFTPRALDADFLLLAGGSGITPVMSIIKSALAEGSGRVTLIYANRDERSVIFADELRALTERYPGRLSVVHWLESVQGLPATPVLRALVEPFSTAESFICGPSAFMDAAAQALEQCGVPKKAIHVERFSSLAGNPFQREDSDEVNGQPETDAVVEVELDGQRTRLSWPARTRLLDLLLEAGLDAPYSCRQGACSACACRIQSGEVKMLHNDILEQEDLDEGIVLACQALPVTEEVHVSYE